MRIMALVEFPQSGAMVSTKDKVDFLVKNVRKSHYGVSHLRHTGNAVDDFGANRAKPLGGVESPNSSRCSRQ